MGKSCFVGMRKATTPRLDGTSTVRFDLPDGPATGGNLTRVFKLRGQ
jgi:hypothetical protein